MSSLSQLHKAFFYWENNFNEEMAMEDSCEIKALC